jgi:predicted outer membrane lipoprotein
VGHLTDKQMGWLVLGLALASATAVIAAIVLRLMGT